MAKNIALGTGYPRSRGLISWRATRRRAREVFELVSSGLDPDGRVADLGRTERPLVAVARALVVAADVLVLDEPTASLPAGETNRLFTVLRGLRDRGLGVINGALVEFARIDSFIATLGTGSVLYALTGWITGGGRIVPGLTGLPPAFTDLTNSTFLFLPVTFWYVLVIVGVLWLTLEHLPAGRYMYVVGANPRAADLVGIRRGRVVIGAFLGSAVVTAFAGVLLAAQQQIGDPSAGQSYLLPVFVGALLGSTTIKPGRADAVGTLVSVALLAVGLSGLQQLGAAF